MSIAKKVIIDRYFKDIPVGAMFRLDRNRNYIYVRINHTKYVLLKRMVGTLTPTRWTLTEKNNSGLERNYYNPIINRKERAFYLGILLSNGYKPKQETVYVKE